MPARKPEYTIDKETARQWLSRLNAIARKLGHDNDEGWDWLLGIRRDVLCYLLRRYVDREDVIDMILDMAFEAREQVRTPSLQFESTHAYQVKALNHVTAKRLGEAFVDRTAMRQRLERIHEVGEQTRLDRTKKRRDAIAGRIGPPVDSQAALRELQEQLEHINRSNVSSSSEGSMDICKQDDLEREIEKINAYLAGSTPSLDASGPMTDDEICDLLSGDDPKT